MKMKFSELLKSKGFWLLDLICGNSVKIHLNEISFILSGTENVAAAGKINDRIFKLLEHASATTSFYQKFVNQPLSRFPVINKMIIRESFDAFLSSDFAKEKLFPVVTSGSTGTPFKTYQDKNKKLRNTADTIYFANLAGYEIGQRLIYLKIWVKEKMSGSLKYRMQNLVPVDVIHLNDEQIGGLIKDMESGRSTYGILGYASALELICQYLDRKNSDRIKANVKSVISMSETLNDYTKESLQKYFGAPVVARYSNLENGIIAQQEVNGSGRYLINTASYHLEILKMNSDEPAGLGELGRIVVTDLYNFAMPMIRYDTGDIGAMEPDHERPGLLFLSKVEGRKLDLLYDSKGELVSSYIVYKNMWQYTEIRQYQLIQEGTKDYTLKINADGILIKEDQLTKEFKTYLGADATIKIEYVNEIPLLASGKRKKVVNNYKSFLVNDH